MSSPEHTSPPTPPSAEEIKATAAQLTKEAEAGGYHLNPDVEFTADLVEGLLVNQKRYGYWNCPCRLASGSKEEDRDIICPCYYRDADIAEYGACFCALYVNDKIARGEQQAHSIPERRPPAEERHKKAAEPAPAAAATGFQLALPVWRCKVCGYLCGRDEPPERCPICKATKDRFERFIG